MTAESGHALEHERAERERLERVVADLGAQLVSAENRLARIGELELELRGRELELRDLGLAHAAALRDRDEQAALAAHHLRVREELQASASWRLTAPLRVLKGRAAR
jgi:hypothetical protein